MARVEIRNEYAAAEVKKLILEVGYADLLVQEDATDKIVVSTMRDEEKTAEYKCELKDGVLKVNPGNVDIHITVFGEGKTFRKGDIEKDTVLITLPYDMHFEEMELSIGAGKAKLQNYSTIYDHADISVGAGTVSVDHLVVNGPVKAATGAGTVEFLDFKAASASADCGVGTMKLRGAVDGNMDISCAVGSVEVNLDAVEADYNYEISCAVGSVLVNGSKRGGMFSSRSVMCNAGAKGKINMSCGVGRIELLTQKRLAETSNN